MVELTRKNSDYRVIVGMLVILARQARQYTARRYPESPAATGPLPHGPD